MSTPEQRQALFVLLSMLPCTVELPTLGDATRSDLSVILVNVQRAAMRIDSETAARIRDAAKVHMDHGPDALCGCQDEGGTTVSVSPEGHHVITALGEWLAPTEGDLRRSRLHAV